MRWLDGNRIQIDPPRKPKKITGTRFGAILDVNRWATPFEAWCAITRTYEEPFVDTKYTKAGKVIEPKQAEYVASKFPFAKVVSPTDIYGSDYFRQTWGDFFPENPVFGGMWDFLFADSRDVPQGVIECKTTKRAEDWTDDTPEYYALQAALYATLKGLDSVTMVCSILEDSDYDHPEEFIPDDSNTFFRSFFVSERYPNMRELMQRGYDFWQEYVVRGISPPYDERKDCKILKELRKNNISPESDISALVAEAEALMRDIAGMKEHLKPREDRLKTVTTLIKEYGVGQFREGDTQVVIPGRSGDFVITKTIKTDVDKTALEEAGLLEQYSKTSESYRITSKAREQ